MCECCDYVAARGGSPGDPALIAQYERIWRFRTRSAVEQRGFTLQAVDGWPPFAYTIGLTELEHPELVIFGLEQEQAAALLEFVAEGIRDVGVELRDGDPLDVFDWELQCMRIPDPQAVVVRANEFYGRKPGNSVPALQLVYPDVHGVWPWEPDCHLFPGQQPMPGEYIA